jgi:hypothetical protein
MIDLRASLIAAGFVLSFTLTACLGSGTPRVKRTISDELDAVTKNIETVRHVSQQVHGFKYVDPELFVEAKSEFAFILRELERKSVNTLVATLFFPQSKCDKVSLHLERNELSSFLNLYRKFEPGLVSKNLYSDGSKGYKFQLRLPLGEKLSSSGEYIIYLSKDLVGKCELLQIGIAVP